MNPKTPPPSKKMDPTHKKQNYAKNPDPVLPIKASSYMKKVVVNPIHKSSCKDSNFQAKALSVSADFDASSVSLSKTKQNQLHHNNKNSNRTVDPRTVATKDKVKKLSMTKDYFVFDKKVVEKANRKIRKDEQEEDEGVEIFRVANSDREVKGLVLEGSDAKLLHSLSLNSGGVGGGGGGGRRRRSLGGGGSLVDLSDFLAVCGAKVVSADMPPFMQIHAIDCARKTHDSLEKFSSKTLALTLKKEFDGIYGPAWHCIVGTSFGSFVTHSVGGFIYFSMDQKLYVLLFKTTVQRAE